MSLLMDALKKAEEEKKRAAKRLEQVEAESGVADIELNDQQPDDVEQSHDNEQVPRLFTETVELSLEPLASQFEQTQEIPSELEEQSNEDKAEETASNETTSESFSEGLTLENQISSEAFEKTQEAIDLSDTTIIEGLSTEDVSAPFDDTFHGVLLEDEDVSTDVYEETLPGVPAEQLVKDLGGGEFQPTPVAAQTVFNASKSKPGGNSLTLVVLGVLTILAVVSFSVFYYFTITPVTRSLPSPSVARGIETTPVPIQDIEQLIKSDTVAGTLISGEAEETLITAEQPIVEKTVPVVEGETEVERVEPDTKSIEEVVATAEEFIPTEDEIEEQAGVTTVSSEPEPEPEPELIAEAELSENSGDEEQSETVVAEEQAPSFAMQEDTQVDLSLIEISKSEAPKKRNEIIKQAFNAYNAGQYQASKSLYEGVLKSDKDNRDAHLGLAAIAINDNDRAGAYKHYVHLLELNPNDALAVNALIGLSNSVDPVADESVIKVLLKEEGELPYLYFSLGNLYAKQTRWAEAQKAFFDAYRLDTTNPNYVLNLAISLDRLGQYSTALDYYKTALDLADSSSVRFDSVAVIERITALNKIGDPKP